MYSICIALFSLGIIQIFINIFFINTRIIQLRHSPSSLVRNGLATDLCLPNIVVLIPALNEAKTIIETLDYLSVLPAPDSVQIQIVVITTKKELTEEKPYSASTQYAVENYIKASATEAAWPIIHIEYPLLTGNKASQLNYAIRILSSTDIFENCYLCVYDADSRPEKHTFFSFYEKYINVLVTTSKRPEVLQQPSKFFKNFTKIPWLLQLEALCMMRRVFGIEIPAHRRSEQNSIFPVYAYCIGHGMFVDWDYLKSIGGAFPEPHEDVPFGQQLSMRRVPIHSLASFDNCEVVDSVCSLRKQAGRWFINSLLIWDVFKKELHNNTRLIDCICILLHGMADCYSWMHYSSLYIATGILICGFHFPIWTSAVVLALSWADIGVGVWLSIAKTKSECHITYPQKIAYVLASPFREILRSSAVIQGFVYLFKARNGNIGDVMPKAKRK